VLGGAIKVVGGAIGGFLAWDARTLVGGLGDIASSFVGPIVLFLGKLLALAQSVFFMQLGERALKSDEYAMLKTVFRGSVALYNVRIVDGFAGFFSTHDRPFVLGNTIYMKNTTPKEYRPILVHECTHVWQNQNTGGRYVSDWTVGMLKVGARKRWQAELLRGNVHWWEFHPEAQAAFMEDVWTEGALISERPNGVKGSGVFFKDDPTGSDVDFVLALGGDETLLAIESVAYMRGSGGLRLTNLG
ncbi:MAG: hypothetical protein ACRDKE_02740, partial [Solirubrobacterales bacterium]